MKGNKKFFVIIAVVITMFAMVFTGCKKPQLEEVTFKKVGTEVRPSNQVFDGEKIELGYPGGLPKGAVIRYTTDGSEVTEKSDKYEGAITLKKKKTPQVIKARAFMSKAIPAPKTSEHTYYTVMKLCTTVADIKAEIDTIMSDPKNADADYNYIGLDKSLKDLSACFYGLAKKTTFNGDVSQWDTSNIENMSNVFKGCAAYNKPLNWDTSKVTSMESMFSGAKSFNQPLGDNFDTKSVTNMSYMFRDATAFNSSLGYNFDTSNVTNMFQMFYKASNFNQELGKNFKTPKVTDMSYMFFGATKFNKPLGAEFVISAVIDQAKLNNMFMVATSFNQNLSHWTVDRTKAPDFDTGATAWEEKNKPKNK